MPIHFFYQSLKNKQEGYEIIMEICQEMMIRQQEIYWIICIIKFIINSLV